MKHLETILYEETEKMYISGKEREVTKMDQNFEKAAQGACYKKNELKNL